jgi:hypothetical protein
MEKRTDTFSCRDRLRIFDTEQTFDGEPVLSASSTQDVGIAFQPGKKHLFK